MDDSEYYNLRFEEMARQFGIREEEVRNLLKRGALDAQFREGQYWVHLGPRRGENRVARLWHGTSADRIDSILQCGLNTVSKGHETPSKSTVWLTTSELRARKHAIGRSWDRDQLPFVVGCEVDLAINRLFWKPSPNLYVFCQPLGSEVIKTSEEVDEREWSRRFRLRLRKARRKEIVNVEVTRNSGRLGVLFWINTYLEKYGIPEVTEDNPDARAIVEWVIREYEAGREDPMTAEELEERALALLDESS